MTKAHAVVFTAPGAVEYIEIDCPDPGPDDVVVRVTHSWISNGTEGSYLRGERIAGDTPYRPGDPWPFPIVPGYQKIGIVGWVGAGVADIAVGETVFVAMGKVEGMFARSGGHVSPSVSPRSMVWKLPKGADPLAFSGLVLTQVGYNCGARAPVQVGDGAIVLGDGMVGQWAAQTLAWRGARVVMLGHHPERMELFAPGPMRHAVDTSQSGWTETVKDLLPGGAAVVVDTVGSIEALEELLPLLNRYGHVVSAGFYGTDDRLALQPLRYGERSVDLVSGWQKERMDATRDLIAAGHLETLPLITHHFAASRAADAWKLIREKSEPVLGVILDW
jgi:2-desacetyl-2-hydroxyethyl bacteriochlorophyllide A dehydrogenase